MQRIDRRDFLKIGAGAAVVLGASPLLGSCGDSGESIPSTPTSPPLTRVAIVKGGDLRAMARDVLDAVGGIGSVVGEGQTVFIKPNFVTIGWQSKGREAIATGECTKPEILMAVAEECLKVGASEVIIGDGSQMPTWPWDKIMTLDRSTNMAAEAQRLTSAYEGKVTLACLDADSPEWVDVPTRTSLEKISVSSLVARADRVISIPVLKTHQWAQMTLSMKCLIGTTPLARYGAKPDGSQPRVVLHGTDASIEQVFLDIIKGLTPDLAIIDASIGIEGDGPALSSDTVATVDVKDRIGGWLLLASKDLAAADATAARLTGHDVSKIRQLNMALEQGVGEIREEKIEIVGERLEDVRMEWIAATPALPGQMSAGPHYYRHQVAV